MYTENQHHIINKSEFRDILEGNNNNTNDDDEINAALRNTKDTTK